MLPGCEPNLIAHLSLELPSSIQGMHKEWRLCVSVTFKEMCCILKNQPFAFDETLCKNTSGSDMFHIFILFRKWSIAKNLVCDNRQS